MGTYGMDNVDLKPAGRRRWLILRDGQPAGYVKQNGAGCWYPQSMGGTDAPRATRREAVLHALEMEDRRLSGEKAPYEH